MDTGIYNPGTNSVGMDINLYGSGSGPSNGYVAEDGTTNYVAEDGTTYYVQES